MSLNASKVKSSGGKEQLPIENGTYPARLVQVVDLGMQPQRPFKGEDKPPAYTISTTYELLDEFCLDEEGEEDKTKPRWIFETMPLHNIKADRATSTKRYLAIDPKKECEGDWTALIGQPCLVTLVNNESNGKIYTNVAATATMRPKDADKAPELVNPTTVFTLDEPDLEVLGGLAAWVQGKIKDNLEFKGSLLETALNGCEADEGTEEDDSQAEEGSNDGETW